MDPKSLLRMGDALLAQDGVWEAINRVHQEALGLDPNGSIVDDSIVASWLRGLQINCWVEDALTGTFPSAARQFSAGGPTVHPTSPEQLNAFMRRLKPCLGGNLTLGIHTGIYQGGEKTPWNKLTYENFKMYVEAADEGGWGVDYHPTCFDYKEVVQADCSLATLSSSNKRDRRFAIDHVLRTLDIAQQTAARLKYKEKGKRVFVNLWIIDGGKDDQEDLLTPGRRYGFHSSRSSSTS